MCDLKKGTLSKIILLKNASMKPKDKYCFFKFFFIEKLRQLTHVVGTLSHKGIARRALPASGGKNVVRGGGGNRKSK